MNWDERYRTGDTPWNHGEAHPALVEWLKRSPLRGRVLVPGCGVGHDVRAIAAHGAEVTGLDIAPRAVDAARKFPPVDGARYEAGDFFDRPDSWCGTFDWVVEHTCFCAIDPTRREDYVQAAARLLKPDGRLLAIFYINPAHEGDGPPYGCSREELDRLFGGEFRLDDEVRPAVTFEGREDRELLRVLAKRR